jgi:hypothetical protein
MREGREREKEQELRKKIKKGLVPVGCGLPDEGYAVFKIFP